MKEKSSGTIEEVANGDASFEAAVWPSRHGNDWHKMLPMDYPGKCNLSVIIEVSDNMDRDPLIHYSYSFCLTF